MVCKFFSKLSMGASAIGIVGVAAVSLLWNSHARAEVVPSIEADGALVAAPSDSSTDTGPGFGINGYVGYSPDWYPILVLPELGLGNAWYFDRYNRRMFQVSGGVRGGIAGPVEPSVSLHGGYGLLHGEDGDAVLDRDGFTGDVGVQVMWRLERWLTLGPKLTYRFLLAGTGSGTEATHFLGLGLRAGFWL